MISQRFLVWQTTASTQKRAAAASALARAFISCDMDFEDRCGAEAAMTVLLDDPSPKVRLAFAEAIASSPKAPVQIVAALAHDRFEIASIIIARSPVLADHDLEMIVPVASEKLRQIMARRPTLSARLVKSLARYGGALSSVALLDNPNARMSAEAFRNIATRLADNAEVRGRLLQRNDTDIVARYVAMRAATDALGTSPLGKLFPESDHLARVAKDGFTKNLVHLFGRTTRDNCQDLIDALRANNDLTTTQLIRAACFGKIDFLAQVFANLSGETLDRVTAIMVQNRRAPQVALLGSAGIAEIAQPIFIQAIDLWKQVATGHLDIGTQEVTHRISEYMREQASDRRDAANDDIQALLRAIFLETKRENALYHARALAEAA